MQGITDRIAKSNTNQPPPLIGRDVGINFADGDQDEIKVG